MTRPLSPAAQAVVDAFDSCALNSRQWHDGMGPQLKLAAALRAVADAVMPLGPEPDPLTAEECTCENFYERGALRQRQRLRAAVLAIANELDPRP